jgi:hypothetical protein
MKADGKKWFSGLKRFIRECREKRPIPNRNDLSNEQEIQCRTVVVEVKTTDAYRIDLQKIANYRRELIASNQLSEDQSSILLVVGRQDTGDLEAQIRGSRHAWDVRLISVDAILRLMFLKEKVDDPATIRKICDILKPREFTRLDEIVDLVFTAAEEAAEPEAAIDEEEASDQGATAPRAAPAAFHGACIARVEKHLGNQR